MVREAQLHPCHHKSPPATAIRQVAVDFKPPEVVNLYSDLSHDSEGKRYYKKAITERYLYGKC